MKLFCRSVFVFLTVVALSSCAQKKRATVKVFCLQPYCGGARPTQEMEQDAQKPKPFANKMIIIVSGSGKVDSAKTDDSGTFSKKMATGKYKLYEAWRYYRKTPLGDSFSNFDKECLEKEWTKHFMEVKITKSAVSQESDSPIVIDCPWNVPCILEQHLPPQRE